MKRFYSGLGAQYGWSSDWANIESHILAEVLPNAVGRLGTVEDVADLIVFLSSPMTGYINAANIRIDGGSTRAIN